MKMYDIAGRVADCLACETGLAQNKVDKLRYGLEILLGEVIKTAILLALSALLGVLPEALAAMIGMSVFRMTSGGAHCEDYWRCLVFGMFIFLGVGELGVYVGPYISQFLMIKTIAAGSIIMALLVVIWAPGEVAIKKIKPEERVLFKRLSLVFLLLWAALLMFLIVPHSISVAVAGFLGAVVQAFSFIPPGKKAINNIDIALSRLIGERRCSTHAENA